PIWRPISTRTSSTRVGQTIYAKNWPPLSGPRRDSPPGPMASRSKAGSRFRTSVSRLSPRQSALPKRKGAERNAQDEALSDERLFAVGRGDVGRGGVTRILLR